MDLATFIQKRRPTWRELEAILQRVEGSGLSSLDDGQAVEFGRLYRSAASDLNQAQTFVSGDATVQYLNDLVARCYLVIYNKSRTDLWGLVLYLFWGYPQIFRRYFKYVMLATAICAAGTLFGFLASYYDPLGAQFLRHGDFEMIQPNEEGEEDQTPLQTTGQFQAFSMFLFTNNAGVCLFAFALGITYGIGTAWLMWTTGIMIGEGAAMFLKADQFQAYLTGILPHGVLEIPACWIAAAAGFVLAEGMIRARPWPRREEMARAGKQALFLVGGCIPLMAVAAILEAGVARAPDWFLGAGLKLAVAGFFALLFAAYLLLLGWGKRDQALIE
ncbi:MAG: stage II sporulation protein M [Gemmataceae bacterium]|nr:stage II sporulation protein M [Gemmataceae bacterium]